MTKLKLNMWQNSKAHNVKKILKKKDLKKCDKTQTENVTKNKNWKCDKIQKLKMWEN